MEGIFEFWAEFYKKGGGDNEIKDCFSQLQYQGKRCCGRCFMRKERQKRKGIRRDDRKDVKG